MLCPIGFDPQSSVCCPASLDQLGFSLFFSPFSGADTVWLSRICPPPSDPSQLVILAQAVFPHFSEHPLNSPFLEIAVSRAARVVFPGKHFPLTARAQKVEDPIKDFSRICWRPSPRPPLRFLLRNEFFDLFPKLITNVSPAWSPRKRLTVLLPSHSGSPPTKGTLARNLQKF